MAKQMKDFQIKMDAAADEARENLQTRIDAMTDEQLEGINILADWWKTHFKFAGHKRLGRILANIGQN